jgi:WhiB family redox-sensing transcriptional regulator
VNDAVTVWLMTPGGPDLPTIDDFLRRPAWMARAACRGTGTDAYFPTVGATVAPARAVCAGCPVREPCLAYALADPELAGVWGGTSARERDRIRRERAA